MTAGIIVAQIILAVCFGVAAAAKLRDGGADVMGMRALGLPVALARPLRLGLPAMEATTAALVAWAPTARVGAVLAALLLIPFTALVMANLGMGRRPPCHCFGSASTRPLGPLVLVRNLLLLAAVPPVVLNPSGVRSPTGQALVAAVVVIGVQGWLLWQGWRSDRRLLRTGTVEGRGDAPTLGRPATPFRLPATDGSHVSLGEALRIGGDVLLVFVDPDCAPCHRLLPTVAGWQRDLAGALAVLVVSRGGVAANATLVERTGISRVLVQRDFEVAEAYGVRGTPSGVLVHRDGTLSGMPVAGADGVAALVAAYGPRLGSSVDGPLSPPLDGSPDAPLDGHRPEPSVPGVAADAAVPVALGRDAESGEPVPAADPAGRWTVVLAAAASCPDCETVLAAAVERFDNTSRHRLVVLMPEAPAVLTLAPSRPATVVAVDAGLSAAHGLRLAGVPAVTILDAEGQPLTAPAVGTASALATLAGLATVTA